MRMEGGRKVSHMLFAEHAFGCYRLIMGNVVINSGIFCFAEYERMMVGRHQVSEIY